jgi:DNA polymerase III epsilon subunit-like protein
MPTKGIFVVDTIQLFAALEGDGGQNGRSLDRICKHLQIYPEYLHNAGNDAHVCVRKLNVLKY